MFQYLSGLGASDATQELKLCELLPVDIGSMLSYSQDDPENGRGSKKKEKPKTLKMLFSVIKAGPFCTLIFGCLPQEEKKTKDSLKHKVTQNYRVHGIL